jgi:toxin ParE1/3/4
LLDIEGWISEAAGDAVATRHVQRLIDYCERFDLGSERGISRDDLFPNLRIAGFEKRVNLAFIVYENEVVFINIFYGGQNWEAAFLEEDT